MTVEPRSVAASDQSVDHAVTVHCRQCYHQKPMNRDNEKDCLRPSELVRTEAAALEALAARLDGAMATDFDRAVESDCALR